MRTIASRWRNLARGNEKLLELEFQLQATWQEKVRRVQQQKYQADLAAWSHRQERGAVGYQDALKLWTESVDKRNSHLRDAASSGVRRSIPLVPSSILIIMFATLFGIIDFSAAEVLAFGILVGFIIALLPAALALVELANLHSRKPSSRTIIRDSGPRQENPVTLDLSKQWWQQIEDDGSRQGKARVEYGDIGESIFFRHLVQNLSDDHIGIRDVLVRPGLDVDLLVVGPTKVWIFEVIKKKCSLWTDHLPMYAS